MTENDALYEARGEMAHHLVQQGLSALVYPNKLEAHLFPEEYAGLEHIVNQMDTDFSPPLLPRPVHPTDTGMR